MKSLFAFLLLCLVGISCNNVDDELPVAEGVCPDIEIQTHKQFLNTNDGDFFLNNYRIVENTIELDLKIPSCNFQRDFRFLIDEDATDEKGFEHNCRLNFNIQSCNNPLEYTICFDISALKRPKVLTIFTNEGFKKISIN